MRPIYSNRITTRYHLRALMSPTLIPRTRDLTDLSSQPWYSRNYSWISFFKLQFLCRQNITLKSSTQCTIGFEGKMKLLFRICLHSILGSFSNMFSGHPLIRSFNIQIFESHHHANKIIISKWAPTLFRYNNICAAAVKIISAGKYLYIMFA